MKTINLKESEWKKKVLPKDNEITHLILKIKGKTIAVPVEAEVMGFVSKNNKNAFISILKKR